MRNPATEELAGKKVIKQHLAYPCSAGREETLWVTRFSPKLSQGTAALTHLFHLETSFLIPQGLLERTPRTLLISQSQLLSEGHTHMIPLI